MAPLLMRFASSSLSSVAGAAKRLDRLSAVMAVTAGLTLGLLIGLILAGFPIYYAAPGFIVLMGLSGCLAWSGQPVMDHIDPELPFNKPNPKYWTLIAAGSFQMGGKERNSEQPLHKVQLNAFYCQRTPVTRRLYKAIVGTNPSHFPGAADERPVENVSWYDAVRFCNRWSEQERLSPCYVIDNNKVVLNCGNDGYRLLTEAEWEYACRAGSTESWYFGDDKSQLGKYAWYSENSEGKTHEVGQKKANAWGLHDMHGNVWEWVQDSWHDDYNGAPIDGSAWENANSDRSVLRGGAFYVSPWDLRSAFRNRFRPEGRNRDGGFRCARRVPASMDI